MRENNGISRFLEPLIELYAHVYFEESGFSKSILVYALGKTTFKIKHEIDSYTVSFSSYNSNVRIMLGRQEDSFPCQTCL